MPNDLGAPIAPPGHNNPPESTPFELSMQRVEDIYSEAKLWLDGAAVDSQELADGIGNLLDTIRKARKFADDARKVENKPFDDGKAEVQARYNPLLQKADLASAACKKALAPWLQKQTDEIAERARKAREEADAKRLAAEAALRASDATNLVEREAAEALLKDAKRSGAAANAAERQTAKAGSGLGRAVSLRTTYRPEITDATAFARYLWMHDRQPLLAFLNGHAKAMVDSGQRLIPGVDVIEEKVPV